MPHRVITLAKKYDHITPVLKELHWLPVRKRIEFNILILAYKCLHGTLHPLTWGKCWKIMSHHGHWDQHPRTYSASREPTWPIYADEYHLVPEPQNYGMSSQIIFGQLGVWQSSNDNWKHICSKMYLSNNYVDNNIYPLTMNVMLLLSMGIWKGRNIK